jgi:outer membrane protein TolC
MNRVPLVALWLLASPAAAQEPAGPRAVTLREAVELAIQANPSMVQARGALSTAHASKREAFGGYLPSLSANSGWSTNSSERFDPNTQRTVSAASNSYSAGISASMTLFDGFRTQAENRSAGAAVDAADAALVNQEFQIVLQTKQAFFNALAADELVRVAETRVQRAEEQLKISRDKLAAGQAIRSDTLRSSVELGNALLQKLNAETQRATAEATLARLIGVDERVRAMPDSALFQPVALDTVALRTEALANSPAVAEAEASARAADASLAVARSQYFPSLSASYSNSYAGAALGDLRNSWSVRLNVSWPIFNGFTREASMARSAVSRNTARAQAEDARRQVNAQLTQFLASLAAAESRIAIASASLAAAEEDLRVQRERYRLGAATIVDVLTSQVSLDQAAVDIVQARLDYLVAKAQIEALIGRAL